MNTTEERQTITAELVTEEARADFLPSLAPHGYIELERGIVFFAKRLCAVFREGSMGYWSFNRLSNGGGFASPSFVDGMVFVDSPDNYCQAELSAEAVGICITLLALSNTWAAVGGDEIAQAHADLTEYLYQHDECGKIQEFLG